MDKLDVKNTDVAISVHHDHLCSVWSLCVYTVTKYCDVGYDHFHAVWGLKILLLLSPWFEVFLLVKSWAEIVMWVVQGQWELTLIQEQQSSLHNSGVKGIQTGLRKKIKKNNKIIFTTFCKHERRQNIGRQKIKRFGKRKNLERDTFCALSERSLVTELLLRVNRLQKASGKSFKDYNEPSDHTVRQRQWLLSPALISHSFHGSNVFLNKNRKSMSGKGRQPINKTGQIIQMDVKEKYPSLISLKNNNNEVLWTGPLLLWQLHIQLS